MVVIGEAPSRSERLMREPVTSIRSTFAPSSSAAKTAGEANAAAAAPLISAKRTDLANTFLCIVYLPGLFYVFLIMLTTFLGVSSMRGCNKKQSQPLNYRCNKITFETTNQHLKGRKRKS